MKNMKKAVNGKRDYLVKMETVSTLLYTIYRASCLNSVKAWTIVHNKLQLSKLTWSAISISS